MKISKIAPAYSCGLMVVFVFLNLIFGLCGCGKTKQTHSESAVLKAYRLIDEQRTDEAIELLEHEVKREPNNREYKVVLASAYAHKAGIKIQKLVPVFSRSHHLQKLNSASTAKEKMSWGEKLNKKALNISALFIRLATVLASYSSIPIIDSEGELYIRHAIELLNSLDKKITQEAALYRAILEVILLKHFLTENFIGEFAEPNIKNEESCRIDLGNLNDSLIVLGKLLIDIYDDLGYANPKQASKMAQQSEETANVISDLTFATTSIAVFDETSTLFLKQAAIESGFGKIIKCSGN